MVERVDLQMITDLYQELGRINAALANLADGTIVAMTIASPRRQSVSISTAGILYPPAMVAGIRSQFQARVTAINQTLAGMGIPEASARP